MGIREMTQKKRKRSVYKEEQLEEGKISSTVSLAEALILCPQKSMK